MHATATPHEVRLAGASPCEDWCCGALYVTVRREGDQPWLPFGITLPVSQDDPVDSQAEHLQARLTAGDPRAIAEVWGGSEAYAEQLGYPWPY
ncbi:hypothetical protein AB8A21_04765 [Streptomyces sp. BF23-18]|uniref:hypothetical protein n=1 Tax=Streptomyces sp. BF23-18 TaxID=3240282 RepID=UPI0034E44CC6